MFRSLFTVGTCFIFITNAADASTPQTWRQFQIDVRNACIAAVARTLKNISTNVDPYGSESFGLALLRGISNGKPVSRICVYDKRSRKVEVSGDLE
jgi:hypothetical protein